MHGRRMYRNFARKFPKEEPHLEDIFSDRKHNTIYSRSKELSMRI